MGRLYDQLKQNIDFLNEIDRRLQNQEQLNMHEIWEVQKAVLNIGYVMDYVDENLQGAIDEGRFEIEGNKSFNIPDDIENMLNAWEDQFDEQQVDGIVDHLKANQRVPSYSPEINEPDPIAYYKYITETLDRVAVPVARGHFGPTVEAFKDLVSSARHDYVNTALEQNFVMDPNVVKIKQEIYPWLTTPHERNMGDVGVDDPIKYVLLAQKEMDAHDREEGLDTFDVRFENNLAFARAVSKVENADANAHDLAGAIKSEIEKYSERKRKDDEPTLGELLSKTRAKLEDKVLFGEIDLYEENEDCAFLRAYLADPVEAMAKSYERKASSPDTFLARVARESMNKMRAERNNFDQANRGVNNGWEAFESNKRDAFEMNIREDYPDFNPAQLADEYKGSFVERNLLRSTSQEWKDVTAAFASWDRNGPEKGNLKKVVSPAVAYLRHKFPRTNLEDITPEMARGLRGVGARRALFCLSVVDAASNAQQDAIEGQREVNDAKIREFELRAGIVHEEPANNNIINNEIQNDFQESLKNDIESENNNIVEAPKSNREERHNENDIILDEGKQI